jgi:hypothetical protein
MTFIVYVTGLNALAGGASWDSYLQAAFIRLWLPKWFGGFEHRITAGHA